MSLKNFSFSILALLLVFSACKEEEQVDNTLRVAFKEFNGTITEVGGTDEVNVVSSRDAESAITVFIGIANDCGGNFDDYSFSNSSGENIAPNEEGQLTVSIPAGQSSTNFSVATADGSLPVGAKSLSFSIDTVENAALNDTHLFYDLRIGTGAGFFSNNYTNNFENCTPLSSPSDFTLFFEEGSKSDRAWSCRGEGVEGGNAVVASAFGGEVGTVDAWLISARRFNFATAARANISMDIKSEFDGNGTLEILWSSDYCGSGNPNAASWTNISTLESQFPAKGSLAYKNITANVTDLLGEAVYLAFRFSEASNNNSASYAIDNLIVNTAAPSGGGGGSTSSSFSTDFEECSEDFSTPAGFAEYFLSDKTDRGWGCRSFGLDGSRAVRASAFGGSTGTDDAWLIVEEQFDFTALSSVNFKMSVFSQFDGSGELLVKYSSDYSGTGTPADASWTAIDVINDQIPTPGSATWVEINEDLTAIAGEVVYIAFQYVGAASDGAASFDIDNLAINDEDAFTGGGGGGTEGDITEFETDFETCSADFATPAGFLEIFEGDKTDRGWGCRQFGLDDSRAVQASAFGGAAGEDDTWLIIENRFDFSAETSVNILFSIYSNFAGPGQVIMQYSEDYTGSGTVSAATWTEIAAINSQFPAAGSQEWIAVNADIAELGGKSVYIAFQYVGANNSASSSWSIDNLAINKPNAF